MQAIEKRALALVTDGQGAEAKALLFAEPYQQEERALVAAAGYQLGAMLMGRPQIVIDSEQQRRGKLAVALNTARGSPAQCRALIFSLRSTLRHINRQRRSEALVRES